MHRSCSLIRECLHPGNLSDLWVTSELQKRVNSLIIISNYMISLGASSRLHALNYSHPRLLVVEEERDQFADGFLLICRFF
jgi:hypothetical protein